MTDYKLFNKDVIVYSGQDTTIKLTPIGLDGWKFAPADLDIVGFVYRPGDDIGIYNQAITIVNGVGSIPYDPDRRFDYSYRYNLYVIDGGQRKLFQFGNVIFKNEHREPNVG